jgi:hypothetical protein
MWLSDLQPRFVRRVCGNGWLLRRLPFDTDELGIILCALD